MLYSKFKVWKLKNEDVTEQDNAIKGEKNATAEEILQKVVTIAESFTEWSCQISDSIWDEDKNDVANH